MHKTNFRENDKDQVQVDTRIEAARKFALEFTTHGIKSYSQWFPGKENIVRVHSLAITTDLTKNSPLFFIALPPIRCQAISR